MKLVMLDDTDSYSFRSIILKENEKVRDTNEHEARLCLYNFNTGSYLRTTRDPLDIDKLETNPKFLELLVRAKFINGETDYRPSEVPYLKEWLQTQGAEKMYELFKGYILSYKAESKAFLSTSILGTIFEEMGIILS